MGPRRRTGSGRSFCHCPCSFPNPIQSPCLLLFLPSPTLLLTHNEPPFSNRCWPLTATIWHNFLRHFCEVPLAVASFVLDRITSLVYGVSGISTPLEQKHSWAMHKVDDMVPIEQKVGGATSETQVSFILSATALPPLQMKVSKK